MTTVRAPRLVALAGRLPSGWQHGAWPHPVQLAGGSKGALPNWQGPGDVPQIPYQPLGRAVGRATLIPIMADRVVTRHEMSRLQLL